jgi:hypothetical protein
VKTTVSKNLPTWGYLLFGVAEFVTLILRAAFEL